MTVYAQTIKKSFGSGTDNRETSHNVAQITHIQNPNFDFSLLLRSNGDIQISDSPNVDKMTENVYLLYQTLQTAPPQG
jgi:hypothetical protein